MCPAFLSCSVMAIFIILWCPDVTKEVLSFVLSQTIWWDRVYLMAPIVPLSHRLPGMWWRQKFFPKTGILPMCSLSIKWVGSVLDVFLIQGRPFKVDTKPGDAASRVLRKGTLHSHCGSADRKQRGVKGVPRRRGEFSVCPSLPAYLPATAVVSLPNARRCGITRTTLWIAPWRVRPSWSTTRCKLTYLFS